jgi:branched-subunit amino acid ABC-type transport system permease component
VRAAGGLPDDSVGISNTSQKGRCRHAHSPGRGRNTISTLFDAIGFGLVTAAVIALAATAVSLQVSVTNFVNFEYGDFMTFGAYIAWTATDKGLNLVEALVLGGIATGVLGVLANVFVFRPFIRRGLRPVTLLIAGVAISFILQSGITMVWSAQPQRFPVSVGLRCRSGHSPSPRATS